MEHLSRMALGAAHQQQATAGACVATQQAVLGRDSAPRKLMTVPSAVSSPAVPMDMDMDASQQGLDLNAQGAKRQVCASRSFGDTMTTGVAPGDATSPATSSQSLLLGCSVEEDHARREEQAKRRDEIRKRNALYARRTYARKKAQTEDLRKNCLSLQAENQRLKMEHKRLQGLLDNAHRITRLVDAVQAESGAATTTAVSKKLPDQQAQSAARLGITLKLPSPANSATSTPGPAVSAASPSTTTREGSNLAQALRGWNAQAISGTLSITARDKNPSVNPDVSRMLLNAITCGGNQKGNAAGDSGCPEGSSLISQLKLIQQLSQQGQVLGAAQSLLSMTGNKQQDCSTRGTPGAAWPPTGTTSDLRLPSNHQQILLPPSAPSTTRAAGSSTNCPSKDLLRSLLSNATAGVQSSSLAAPHQAPQASLLGLSQQPFQQPYIAAAAVAAINGKSTAGTASAGDQPSDLLRALAAAQFPLPGSSQEQQDQAQSSLNGLFSYMNNNEESPREIIHRAAQKVAEQVALRQLLWQSTCGK